MPHPDSVPEPWHSFLRDLDVAVREEVHLVCMGGFVITQLYGFSRPTADIDTLSIAPRAEEAVIRQLGSRGGPLHARHQVYLDLVAVAHLPEDYEGRVSEMFPGVFERLRLFALDPYDLALSKLERNIERDRADVLFLARTIPFDLDILQERYRKELRWQLGNPEREDLTLKLWVEAIEEDRA